MGPGPRTAKGAQVQESLFPFPPRGGREPAQPNRVPQSTDMHPKLNPRVPPHSFHRTQPNPDLFLASRLSPPFVRAGAENTSRPALDPIRLPVRAHRILPRRRRSYGATTLA
ncbi:hypothetical protein GQ55_3G070300 [Panicum hallii var. hallii]|uniref:Uncharacterized protein n=1 Tax=Panicum hallii var. hallii TaxID=1504633 RepID=A0A2T7E6L7_9POAL|nr:hypothetical protein GQ55_3G070300 [Panicum hallii var. hallii]